MTAALVLEILRLLNTCRNLMIVYKNEEMVTEIELVIAKIKDGNK